MAILIKDGPAGFVRALRRNLGRGEEAYRPSESRIVFEATGSDGQEGVMVDVGAHVGRALAPFAERGWQVFAFEPDSENRRKLVERFEGLPNVVIDARALSDRPQQDAVLFKSEESPAISALSAFHSSHVAHEKIDVTTLACFFDEIGTPDPGIDFLKIDTEGFDLFVLKGLPWDRIAPRVILCEFEDAKTVPLGYTFHDLAHFLEDHGYRLIVSEWRPIKRYGGLHDWRRFVTYPCKLKSRRAWGNILAARENDIHDLLLRSCEESRASYRTTRT